MDGDKRERTDKIRLVNLGRQCLVLHGLSFEGSERSLLVLKAQNSEIDWVILLKQGEFRARIWVWKAKVDGMLKNQEKSEFHRAG